MENHSIEGVRHVFVELHYHLPKKPMVHMLWAAFEEQQGKNEEIQLTFWDLSYFGIKIEGLSLGTGVKQRSGKLFSLFSIKGQIVNVLALQAIWSLS